MTARRVLPPGLRPATRAKPNSALLTAARVMRRPRRCARYRCLAVAAVAILAGLAWQDAPPSFAEQ